MSTEATGDLEPDAAEATGPEAGAEGAEPTATAVDEPAVRVPGQAPAPGRAVRPAEAADDVWVDEAGDPLEADEAREPGEGDLSDEQEELGAGDVVYEEYEEYAEYEAHEPEDAEDAAGPQRARRWPRVLLALGFVVLAVAIVGGAIGIVAALTHGFKKPVKVTYKSSPVFSLKTGDCFNPRGQQSYTLVACDSPHQAEVFATFALTGTTWPGNAAVQAKASDGCASRLTSYVNPQLAISLSSTYVYPDPVAWQAGTRTVICEVRATSGDVTGSVRGASASAG
jgi:hypothetical protein